MSLKRRSKVWDYFDVPEGDQLIAVCCVCKTHISRCGVGKKASTSSLLKHLKFKHTQEYSNVQENKRQEEKSESLKPKQQPITNFVKIKTTKKWEITDERSIEIHKAIGEMIALDNQPYTLVNDTGFNRLLETLQPHYKIPSRKYFSETVIPDLYNGLRVKVLENISKAEFVSVTTDMWTSDVNNKRFISLTAHWVTKTFEQKHAILRIKEFSGSHTGENICNVLFEILNEWNIRTEKLHLLLRDGGANIKKAAKDMKIDHESCFIHTQQLIVLDAIRSPRSVSDLIAVARNIVTHFNHSSISREKLETIQLELHMPPKKLIQDVQTRWNSTYYLLERLFEQKRPISLFIADNNVIGSLSQNQWQLTENILLLLKPFEEITKRFSSTDSIISEVIPTLMSLQKYLLQITTHGLGTMKDTLISNIEQRYSGIECNPHYVYATFLDPRFKLIFISDDNRKKLTEEILSQITVENLRITEGNKDLNQQIDSSSDSSDSDDLPLASMISSPKRARTTTDTSVFDIMSEIASTSTSHSVDSSNKKDIKLEIDSYLKQNIIDRNSSPLEWWKIHQNTFPNLAAIVKRYLSAPATTVFSERLFSEAGHVFETQRSRLLAENGEKLVFLHHNLNLHN